MSSRRLLRRPVLGWALYDWANSAFALTVITSFLPVMLGEFWNDGAASTVTTFRLGVANSVASLLVAILSPLLGAVADHAGRRKGFLIILAGLGIVMTGALSMVAQGQWPLGLALFVFASIGFAGGNTFYDSLLLNVAGPDQLHRVSALGFGLGYIGGALMFSACVFMVTNPDLFGFDSPFAAIRVAFLLVALWWALFSLPLLIWVRDDSVRKSSLREALAFGVRDLAGTLRELRGNRALLTFLVAYWLYIDGVDTIIRMAGDYGLAIGLDRQDVILALLLANFVGFPSALAFGWIGHRFGARRGIYLGLTAYIVATALAALVDTAAEFFILAGAVGCVQGGVQSLSRSFYASLIPRDLPAQYFGLYNMLGKFAAIDGPVLTGYVALLTGSQRVGILSILILFASGFWLLTRVPVTSVDR